jgi:ABC-type uncharacterized transport system permease subunit
MRSSSWMPLSSQMHPQSGLKLIRWIHTLVWAFFAGAILAIPIAALRQRFGWVLILTALVMVEVMVLALNGMRCPLTAIAARYTEDRRSNFDIYLPQWLATCNKPVFGGLFLIGVVLALIRWSQG